MTTRHPVQIDGPLDFTPAERAQLMIEARKVCRKKFGAIIDKVVIDYYRERIVCWQG